MAQNSMQCPLCLASNSSLYFKHKSVASYKCEQCELVFKDSFLSGHEEKLRYEQHNNDISDPQYLRYLNQLWSLRPSLDYKCILDFGCGPTKGLEVLAPDYNVESYDAYFYPIQLKQYDLVFCCEVVEHFNNPKISWNTLASVTDNILLVRTETYEQVDYANWYYKDDPTHVCFYSYKTLQFMEPLFGLKLLDSKDGNKFIFKKL